MATVKFEIALPAIPGITKIRVYESSVQEGPFNFIQEITDVGAYPNYIDYIEVTNAADENDWFALKWADDQGVESQLSDPFKGGTQSIVGEISQRVIQRGVTATNEVVVQEAEAVAEQWFGMNPYDVDVTTVNYSTTLGLTYLVMARLIMLDITSGSSDSYTAGLVSQKSQTGGSDQMKFLADLLQAAQDYLGIPRNLVMELADFDPTGLNTQSSVNFDQTRQAITINFE